MYHFLVKLKLFNLFAEYLGNYLISQIKLNSLNITKKWDMRFLISSRKSNQMETKKDYIFSIV
jgi:hypothetical protein